MNTDTTEGNVTEKQPLEGMRVIDLSRMIAGGYATMLMADFGADVIKVEHPEIPDDARTWLPKDDDGTSLYFKSLNRNKRAITLDLGTERGQNLLKELVADADVLVENFTPGTMEKWGLGYDALKAVNEEIIMVRVSGYGQTGPKSEWPGYGTIAEGFTGWAHQNRFPDTKPLLPPISLADIVTALFTTQSTMMAIYEREVGENASRQGQVIDLSLYESLFRLFIGRTEAYDTTGWVPEPTGNKHHSDSPRGVYETADGYLTISAGSPRTFRGVMEAIGRPELVDDERFATVDDRVENSDEMDGIVESWTRTVTTEEAVHRITECGGVAGPVYDIADIFESEQYWARDSIQRVEDPDVGEVATTGPVPKFSRTPGTIDHLAPDHGEHNEDVFLEELGLSHQQYQEYKENGPIGSEDE
jgi:crotonobetainyl-CoA:carnitine CoA-transferase CaiB-like acyl-CoA transferase